MIRKTLVFALLLACAAVPVFAMGDRSVGAPAHDPAALPEAQAPCAPSLSVDGPVTVMNSPFGIPEPQPAQIPIPACDCTRPGTSIPPGQLGVRCASPIGGPIRHCQSVVCYTSIYTPWINGVCQ